MPKIKPDTTKRKMAISRRPILVVIIILIITLIVLILAKVLTNNAADNVTENGERSDNTTSQTTTQTESTNPNEATNSTEADSNKTPKQYEGENANNYTDLTGAITYAEVSGTDLIIRTTIDQELPTSATCTLTATSGDNSITEQSGVINNPSSSSCEGFTIPTSRLSSGTWQLEIKVTGNNKSGIITGEVTL